MRATWTTIIVTLAAAAGGMTAASALAVTSIAAITDTPASWADTVVTVHGTVTEQSVGHGGESIYTVRGDGRVITVVSHQTAPAPGTPLEVTGTVRVRPPDEEFTFPPVIDETARQVVP
jgi:hypothetical protein